MVCVKSEAEILRGRYAGSSEARREDGVHRSRDGDRHAILAKKNLRCQLLHSFCTIHPQVFHICTPNRSFDRPRTQQVESLSSVP